ncbi:hypothetical protein CEY11_09960 [Candidimonas nitroreducens]|uniref:DUF3300 domain-containing protein n=2 Tax=Candidimonas nitroreducens TaxID=683354 RepID=A0A225MMC3_9BURK|nr:hypothetical protein CEY11_09960 [Candidimonas nitroreducens]
MISAYGARVFAAGRGVAAAGRLRHGSSHRFTVAVAGWACLFALLACLAPFAALRAQEAPPPPLLSPPQLEQLVAPIALYPDALLSQVLMASTYPLEVVEAQRWRSTQPRQMSDQQLSSALQNSPWDPSVQSLAAFPDVLQMMSDRLDWTQQLGEVFLSQQQDLMSAVQRLRERARAAGHLQSTAQQTVQVVSGPSPVIEILPAQPELVYVPVYDPLVVYGAWPYPAYRPFYWHPPRYAPPPGVFISFGAGLMVGHALWGHMDWHRHVVRINVQRYNRYNHVHIASPNWVHRPEHRRGARYGNPALRERYGHGPGGPAFHGGRGPAMPPGRPPAAGHGPGPQVHGPAGRGGPQVHGPQDSRAHGSAPHSPGSRPPGAPGPRPSAAGGRPPGGSPPAGHPAGAGRAPHSPPPAAGPARAPAPQSRPPQSRPPQSRPPQSRPSQPRPQSPAMHGGMQAPHRGPERQASAPRPAANHPPAARRPEGGHGNGRGGGHGHREERH